MHTPEQDLDELSKCVVTGNRLMINYVFGCIGVPRFLVNLKTKATGRLVDSIVKNSLGPLCDATPVQTKRPGEKFVPARSAKKRGNSAVRKTGEATIEREATRVYNDGGRGRAWLLAREGPTETFTYSKEGGLTLVPPEELENEEDECEQGQDQEEHVVVGDSKSQVGGAIDFFKDEEEEVVIDVEGGEESAAAAERYRTSSPLPHPSLAASFHGEPKSPPGLLHHIAPSTDRNTADQRLPTGKNTGDVKLPKYESQRSDLSFVSRDGVPEGPPPSKAPRRASGAHFTAAHCAAHHVQLQRTPQTLASPTFSEKKVPYGGGGALAPDAGPRPNAVPIHMQVAREWNEARGSSGSNSGVQTKFGGGDAAPPAKLPPRTRGKGEKRGPPPHSVYGGGGNAQPARGDKRAPPRPTVYGGGGNARPAGDLASGRHNEGASAQKRLEPHPAAQQHHRLMGAFAQLPGASYFEPSLSAAERHHVGVHHRAGRGFSSVMPGFSSGGGESGSGGGSGGGGVENTTHGKSNRQPAILSAPAPPTDQKPDRQRINSNTADGEAKTRGELSRTDPGVQALHDLSRHGGTKPPPSYRHHGRPPSGHDTGGGGTAGGLSSKNLTSDRRGHGVALHNGGFTGAIMHTRPSAGPGDVGEHRPIKLETPPAESPRLSSARAQSWPSPSCPGWRPVEIGADGRKRRVGVYQHQRMARFEEIEQKMDSESRTRPMELHRPLSTPLPTPPLYTTSRSSTTSCASNGEPLQNDSTFDGSGAVKLEGGGRMHDVPAFAATPTNRATPTLSRQGRRRTAAEVAELLRGRLPTADVVAWFEEGEGVNKRHDAAQTMGWLTALTKVLGHLGFAFEDEHPAPTEGVNRASSISHDRPTSGGVRYVYWVGSSAMSFEVTDISNAYLDAGFGWLLEHLDQPDEFQENLRVLPRHWRSRLSSIMYSIVAEGTGASPTATARSGGAEGFSNDKFKRLEQQAPLEVLKSVIRDMHGEADDGDEANAAAEAVVTMGFMRYSNDA